MARIKGSGTRIEKSILTEMKKRRLVGYQYQAKTFGRPDFVFPAKKIAIFCDGDFWHGYKFHYWESNLNEFWKNKIETNMKRDRKVRNKLKNDGWKVLRLWGHQIKKDPSWCVDKILEIMEI